MTGDTGTGSRVAPLMQFREIGLLEDIAANNL